MRAGVAWKILFGFGTAEETFAFSSGDSDLEGISGEGRDKYESGGEHLSVSPN